MVSSLKLKQVDDLLRQLREGANSPVPPDGWIRTIRQALGMTAAQLAARLGIARQSLDDFERNEASGKITLENLDRLSHALGCRLVYTVVPEGDRTLEDIRRERAHAVAREQLSRAAHSMRLEQQGVSSEVEGKQFERLV